MNLAQSNEHEETGTWADGRAASTPVIGFLEGLKTPWNGLKYMLSHPALFRYAIIPFFLNLLITILLLVLLSMGGLRLYEYLQKTWGGGWIGSLLMILIAIVLVVALLGAGFISWILLQGVLCDHFYGMLAEQVERKLGRPEDEIKEVSFGYQVIDTIKDTSWLLFVNAGCLLLQLIPIIGNVIGIAGGLYFNFMTIGGDHLSHALALRGWRMNEMRDYARKHWPQTLGLGAISWTMALVPLLGSFFLATSAAGAVLLNRRLDTLEDQAESNEKKNEM